MKARAEEVKDAQQPHDRGMTIEVPGRYLEVGRTILDDWCQSTETPILVSDEINVPSTTGSQRQATAGK
jgi:hypothetical protein